MTISTLIRKTIAAGDGVTTAFNFAFQVRSAADLLVYYTDVAGVQTLLASNAYGVVLNPIPTGQLWSAGGTVTYPTSGAAIIAGTKLTIARNVALLQSSSLINQGGYFPDVVEAALDVLTMEVQQINENIARALTLPISSTASTALPNPLASAAIGWDATGTFITNIVNAANLAIPVAVSQGGTGSVAGSAALAALGALGFAMLNGTFVPSVNAGALTIAIKTKAGTDPTAADSVTILFRNSAAATGDYTQIVINQATSFVVSAGSTMGATNNVAFRLWLVGFNDAGTFRLGAVNCLSGTTIMPLRDDLLASSTAEGGIGGADSAQVIYTGVAVAAKPMRVLGYVEWSAGLAAVGTYGIVPTKTHMHAMGNSLPGQPVQFLRNDTGALATGTTVVPFDDTIPQNTEGDQYLAQAITPTSAANVLVVRSELQTYSSNAGANSVIASIFQDAVANALRTAFATFTNGFTARLSVTHIMLAATVAATTFKTRAGYVLAGTLTLNGNAGARDFGGVSNSYTEVWEITA